MKKLVVIFIALLVLACGRVSDPRLLRAEALMDSLPESALCIVQAIDTAALRGDANRALYGLLLTQGRHKCDIPATDDSLITAAARYLAHHGTPRRAMLARFYQAAVQYNAGHRAAALSNALPALDQATRLQDTYWMARAHELIADLYYDSYNMDVAIEHIKSAQALFYQSGHKLNGDYKVAMLARAYGHVGNIGEGIRVLDSIIPAISNSDSVLTGFLYTSYIRSYINSNNYIGVIAAVDSAQKYWRGNYDFLIEWHDLANAYIGLNLTDSARIALNKCIRNNRGYYQDPSYWRSEAKLSSISGNDRIALSLMDSVIKYDHIRAADALADRLSLVERDFQTEKTERFKTDLNRKKSQLLFAIILSVLLCIAIVLSVMQIQRRKRYLIIEQMESVKEINEKLKTEITQDLSQIDILNNTLQQTESELKTKKTLAVELLYSHIKVLDNISIKYYENTGSDKMQRTIMSNFKREIEKMQQEEFLQQIRDMIDKCMNNILQKVESETNLYSKSEIYFIALVLAGFSSRSICLLTNLKIGSYYNKLSKLRSRLDDCPSHIAAELRAMLG